MSAVHDIHSVRRVTPIQQRAQARRERILAAARDAIAEHGIDGFSTSQVADLAGCAVGSIYRYFDDKWAILEALHPGGYLTITTTEEIAAMPRLSVLLCAVNEVFWLPPAPPETPRFWLAAGYDPTVAFWSDEDVAQWGPLRILHHPDKNAWGAR